MTASIADQFVSNVADLVEHNATYAETFGDSHLSSAPTRRLAIVTCMDCRIDVWAVLGLGNGEAHVIRNGGGVVTDDVIRSICLSQRALGTREIVLIHHSECGLSGLSQDEFVHDLQGELGVKPAWSLESFDDPYEDVRQSARRLQQSSFIAYKDHISGFVYDVDTGRLNPALEHDESPASNQ